MQILMMGQEVGRRKSPEEHKLEMVVPNHCFFKVLNAMTKAHPYEEVAYDIFHLLNSSNYGAGIIGELKLIVENGISQKFQKTSI